MSPNKIITNISIGCLLFSFIAFTATLVLKIIGLIATSWWFIISILFIPYTIGILLIIIVLLVIQIFRYYLRFKNYERKRNK